MKLKDDFFTILHEEGTESAKRYRVALNPLHKIYQAHFPGNPITPGVCIIEICRELAEESVGRELAIRVVKNVKFTAVINPTENPEVDFEVSVSRDADGIYKTTASVSRGDILFAKLSLHLADK